MHITPGHRMVQRNLGRALNRLAPILVTANIVCWRVDAARLPTPHRVDTHGPITSSPAVPADALLRDRNAAYSDICGWEAGEDGGDPRAPLQCSSTTSFCALIRPDIIGCCDPQARRVGAPACEYFTTCYASTDVDEAIAKNTRVQRWYVPPAEIEDISANSHLVEIPTLIFLFTNKHVYGALDHHNRDLDLRPLRLKVGYIYHYTGHYDHGERMREMGVRDRRHNWTFNLRMRNIWDNDRRQDNNFSRPHGSPNHGALRS